MAQSEVLEGGLPSTSVFIDEQADAFPTPERLNVTGGEGPKESSALKIEGSEDEGAESADEFERLEARTRELTETVPIASPLPSLSTPSVSRNAADALPSGIPLPSSMRAKMTPWSDHVVRSGRGLSPSGVDSVTSSLASPPTQKVPAHLDWGEETPLPDVPVASEITSGVTASTSSATVPVPISALTSTPAAALELADPPAPTAAAPPVAPLVVSRAAAAPQHAAGPRFPLPLPPQPPPWQQQHANVRPPPQTPTAFGASLAVDAGAQGSASTGALGAAPDPLAQIVRDRVGALNAEIARYQAAVAQQDARAAELSSRLQELSKAQAAVQAEAVALSLARSELRSWRDSERAKLDTWKAEALEKLERERRIAVRQARASAATAAGLAASRAERQELEACRAELTAAKASQATTESRLKTAEERHRTERQQLLERIRSLEAQLQAREADAIVQRWGPQDFAPGPGATAVAAQGSPSHPAQLTSPRSSSRFVAADLSGTPRRSSPIHGVSGRQPLHLSRTRTSGVSASATSMSSISKSHTYTAAVAPSPRDAGSRATGSIAEATDEGVRLPSAAAGTSSYALQHAAKTPEQRRRLTSPSASAGAVSGGVKSRGNERGRPASSAITEVPEVASLNASQETAPVQCVPLTLPSELSPQALYSDTGSGVSKPLARPYSPTRYAASISSSDARHIELSTALSHEFPENTGDVNAVKESHESLDHAGSCGKRNETTAVAVTFQESGDAPRIPIPSPATAVSLRRQSQPLVATQANSLPDAEVIATASAPLATDAQYTAAPAQQQVRVPAPLAKPSLSVDTSTLSSLPTKKVDPQPAAAPVTASAAPSAPPRLPMAHAAGSSSLKAAEFVSSQLKEHIVRSLRPMQLRAGVRENAAARIVSERSWESNGKVERRYDDGTRLVVFRNGTEKEQCPDGTTIVRFNNGDVKRSCAPGEAVSEYYYFAESRTLHTAYDGGGYDIYEFPSGQLELHWRNALNSKEILYPDGSAKVTIPDASQQR